MVFLPFSSVSLTELCSFWYVLKDLFTLHKLSVEVMISSFFALESMWTSMGHYGQLRGEWVNQKT